MKRIKLIIHAIIRLLQSFLLSVCYIGKNRIVINCAVYLNEYNLSYRKGNFGDDINIPIMEALTGKKVVLYRVLWKKKQENLLPIGSIVEKYTNENSIVWGSGAINGIDRLKETPKQICAVRGPLTRQYLQKQGVECPEVYGDPALLLPQIYHPAQKKKYKLGIIPHYTDYDLPHVRKFRESHPEVLFIQFRGYKNWRDVVDKILSCEQIASSSLHGLIISDAYQIPNVRIKLSDAIEGGDFKYDDYYLGVERKPLQYVDCRCGIDISALKEIMSDYIPINYDVNQLLNVFPYKLDENFKIANNKKR